MCSHLVTCVCTCSHIQILTHTHIFATLQVLTHVYILHIQPSTHVHKQTNPAHTQTLILTLPVTHLNKHRCTNIQTHTATQLLAQLHTLTDTVAHTEVCRITSTAAHMQLYTLEPPQFSRPWACIWFFSETAPPSLEGPHHQEAENPLL